MRAMEIKLKALTSLWTGGVDQRPDRLHEAGLMGSLRLWFEVLVRGLGGHACDPTVKEVRCTDENGHRCVVCELFGCTGWARKFRLMVVDENGEVIRGQIQANHTFILRFISLRPIRKEEWRLLDATLRLIAKYGAIGGKTVFKPSDEPARQNAPHHRDFGLISVEERPNDLPPCNREQLERYFQQERWRKNIPYRYQGDQEDGRQYDYSWASLEHFWCVKGRYLAREDSNTSSFNFVIGRPEPKSRSSQGDSWLAGRRPNRQRGIKPDSKKVFSFEEPENARRTFGFVQNNQELSLILKRLEVLRDGNGNGRQPERVWQGFNPNEDFLTGEQIQEQLLRQEESA